jgi:hypothetical protein
MHYFTVRNIIKMAIAIAIIAYSQVSHGDRYVTLGGIAEHIGSDGYYDSEGFHNYNERGNNVAGVEFVSEETQLGLGHMEFDNSYYNKGSLSYVSKYWKLNEHVRVGVLGGVVQGYKDWQVSKHVRLGNELHAMVAPVVKVENENWFAQAAAFGNAVVITLGAKF